MQVAEKRRRKVCLDTAEVASKEVDQTVGVLQLLFGRG
jgi:hypothetical protein